MDARVAKGPNFIFAKAYIRERHGDEFWEKLLASLPASAAAEWQRPLLPGGIYDFLAFKALVHGYADLIHGKDDTAMAQLYEYTADRSLNTLYKAFFRLTQPGFVIRRYPALWAHFFTTGTVGVPVVERGHALLEFTLPDMFRDWLSPACLGYSRKAVTMAGGRDLKQTLLETVALQDATSRTRFELRWSE